MKPVIINRKHRALLLPESRPVREAFPSAPAVPVKGKNMVVLDHDEDVTRVVRELGYDAPAPFMEYYDWDSMDPPAFEAQKITGGLVTMYKRAYVLNDMGTGKTRTALWAFDWLKRTGKANKMLIVAPLSTLNRVWVREIMAATPHLRYAVLHGTARRRGELLDDTSVDVYIINHDGVQILRERLNRRSDIDVFVLDELAVYRNGTSIRSRVMRDLASARPYVWGMTGSPTPQAPTDAWAQAKIVTPWTVPMSFGMFRDSVMLKVTSFKWQPKKTAAASVHRMLQPAVRFTMDDIIELPEVVYRFVEVQQSQEQKDAYKKLESHLRLMHNNNEITAMNSAVLMGKLLQVSLGWVYGADKKVVALRNDDRMDALANIVESTDHKVIVFVPYIHAIEGTAARLRKEGHTVEVVSGDVPPGERNRIFGMFQETDKPRVLVAHPQCMAHGLTLTAADTIVWLGPFASLEVFDQANARITRVGQKHRQQVIMLAGTAVERRLYKALRGKQQVQNLLLDMLREQTENRG
jgi:SNF2 family DNA or RNA helicase